MVAIPAFAAAFAAIANFFYFASHPDSFVSEMAAYAVLGASSSSVVKPAVLMAIEYMSPVFESDYSKLILPRLSLDNLSLSAAPSISAISHSARWLSSAPALFNRRVQLFVEPYNTVPLISPHPFAPKLYLSPGLNYLRNDTRPSECRPAIHWADSEYRTGDIPRIEDFGTGLLAATTYADYVDMTSGMNPLSYGYCSITETSYVSNPPLNVTYIPEGLSSGKTATSNATEHINLKQSHPLPWTFSLYFNSPESLRRMDQSSDNQTSPIEDQLLANWAILGTADFSQVSLRAFDLETYPTPTEEKSANETWELSVPPTELPIASKLSKFSAPLVLWNDTCPLRHHLVTTWDICELPSLHNPALSERNGSLSSWWIGALVMAALLLVGVFTYQYQLSSQSVEEASHTYVLPLSPPCWMLCQCKPFDKELGDSLCDIPVLLYLYTMYDKQAPSVPLLDPGHVSLPEDVSDVLFELPIPMSPIFAEDQSFYDDLFNSTMNSMLYESSPSGLVCSDSDMSLASLCGGLSFDSADHSNLEEDVSSSSDLTGFNFTFAYGINAQSSPIISSKRLLNNIVDSMKESENVQLRPSKRQRLEDELASIGSDSLDRNNVATIGHNRLDSTSCNNSCDNRSLATNNEDPQSANLISVQSACGDTASLLLLDHEKAKEVEVFDSSPGDTTIVPLDFEATPTKSSTGTKTTSLSQGSPQTLERQGSYFDFDSDEDEDENSFLNQESEECQVTSIATHERIGSEEKVLVPRISPPRPSRVGVLALGISLSTYPRGKSLEQSNPQDYSTQGSHFDFGFEENQGTFEDHGLQEIPRIIVSEHAEKNASLPKIPPRRPSRNGVPSLELGSPEPSPNLALQQTHSQDRETRGSYFDFDSDEDEDESFLPRNMEPQQRQQAPRPTAPKHNRVKDASVAQIPPPRSSRTAVSSPSGGLDGVSEDRKRRLVAGDDVLNNILAAIIRSHKRSKIAGVPALGRYSSALKAVAECPEDDETGTDSDNSDGIGEITSGSDDSITPPSSFGDTSVGGPVDQVNYMHYDSASRLEDETSQDCCEHGASEGFVDVPLTP